MFASKRTLPEDASTSFAVRGKKSILMKPNSLFGAIAGKQSLKPNLIFGSYGKRPTMGFDKRAMKPNSLFVQMPGRKSMKPNSLFQIGNRSMKRNSLFRMGYFGWEIPSGHPGINGRYQSIEDEEPEYLDVEDVYEDEAEKAEIAKVKRGMAEFWARQRGDEARPKRDSNFWAAR